MARTKPMLLGDTVTKSTQISDDTDNDIRASIIDADLASIDRTGSGPH